MEPATPDPAPPRRRYSVSRRTVERVGPYLWRRRWIVALTLVSMFIYSLGVNLRNLIPAVFFDGVLLTDDLGEDSVLTSRLRPVLERFGWIPEKPPRPFQQAGGFKALRIESFDSIEELGSKDRGNRRPLEEAVASGRLTFLDGEASYTFLGPEAAADGVDDGASVEVPTPTVPFTRLRVRFDPDSLERDVSGSPRLFAEGVLQIEHRPRSLDPRKMGLLQFLFAFGIVIVVVIATARFCHTYFEGYIIQHILADLRRDLIDHMCGLSLGFINRRSRGDLLSRISTDLNGVSQSLQIVFGDLLQKPITFLIALGTIFYINWKLSLIVFAFFPFLFFIVARFGKKVRRRSHKQSTKRGIMTTALEQLFSGFRTVKSFSMEEFEKKHFEEKNRAVVREGLRTLRAKIISHSAVELTSHLGVLIALGVGGYLLLEGTLGMSIGDLLAYLTALNLMYMPVKALARAYTTVQESLGAMERVTEIFESRPTILEEPEAAELPPFQTSIRFENVSFSYGRETVLQDIDLEIPAGSLTAVVGPTGAGKSTLVDLILRFHDPTVGCVAIDGVDIRDVKLDSLLAQISIVSQEPFLFDTTIGNNILYGRPGATPEEIEQAARMANIHDFITSLPQGYDTPIGDRGVLLSGGQRQRITIARSLLKDAPILILDEATSNLDAQSEAAVQDAIERLIRVRSTIAIAHRLSTIRSASKIVVLNDGRIVDTGTFDELLARRGLFYDLYRTQFDPGENGGDTGES